MMSTSEFIGVWLGLCIACTAALCIRIGYETARMHQWRITLVYLRLGGLLSVATWLVMMAVLTLHDENEHTGKVVQQTAAKVHTQTLADVTISTPGGSKISWNRPVDGNPPVWQISRGI